MEEEKGGRTESSSLAVYAVELRKQILRLELDLAVARALAAQANGMVNLAEMRLLSLRDLLPRCEAEVSAGYGAGHGVATPEDIDW